MLKTLHGALVTLRLAVAMDIPVLAGIRAKPEVYERWRGGADLAASVADDLDDPDVHPLVIEHRGQVVGMIQWGAETDPDYRHANIDIYVDPDVHGQGLGTDAIRTLARHLFVDHGHHRIVIDPAADNAAAIRCYSKVGFRPVGLMRSYERDPDGSWHDGLLMDLLADELIDTAPPTRPERTTHRDDQAQLQT
ncbi:GNAT family N-acetyltransferase [Micromonospora sp. NBC_00362]|uniref:GNAT family N-acetyltransferase n=1 Tax=Micromonospora sp. NBC_00362 TaxID=2975975 RepID=UPI00224E23D9|nr:GNAT family protein [Micromonospora sp. NBC_00362]MCX5121734.1 GNAT family N-acetyltransferase [Micromonospora sp. NBC_00362]